MEKENVHEGHRKRMREKLNKHGATVFDTYELVEMLLYSVLPYKDTNPLAKKLLSECGGVDGIFSKTEDELIKIEGIGRKTAKMLLAVGEYTKAILSDEREDESIYDSYTALGDHYLDIFLGDKTQRIVVTLFDSMMRMIHEETVDMLDFSSAAVRAEHFISLAIKHHAAALSIAHNHVFGPLYPTSGDIETNKLVTEALSASGISFIEHYVVSGDSYVGFMNDISQAFAQSAMIKRFISSKRRQA